MIIRKTHKRLRGFTLLEMTIVVSIIAVVVATGAYVGSTMINSAKVANTNNKLDAIEKALLAFRLANNRLPCPGDFTASTQSTYGYESVNAGVCTTGSTYDGNGDRTAAANPGPTVTYKYSVVPNTLAAKTGTAVVEGTVPMRTLNLPDEFMYDGWGRKFAYAVWAPFTGTGAFTNYGLYANCGAITVNNAAAANRSIRAAYVLVSYGPNGHGGYLGSTQQFSAGSTNSSEQTNCHCNSSAVNQAYTATYIQKDPTLNPASTTDSFDDIVRYKERWQLQSMDDQYYPYSWQPCKDGTVITATGSGARLGYSVAVGDVNGDGIPDLIMGAPNGGAVYVIFGSRLGFPDPLSYASLNGSNGFSIIGTYTEQFGTSVAVADVNGDGIADIIVGAPSNNSNTGAVYVIFGSRSAWPASLNVSTLNGTNGFQLKGAATGDSLGYAVAAGDVDGDGIADIVVGAPNHGTNTGAVYTVYGGLRMRDGTAWSTCPCTLPVNNTNGVEDDGPGSSTAGSSVAVGDVNGDGKGDIIIGAPAANGGAAGAAYVLFGPPAAAGSAYALSFKVLLGGAYSDLNKVDMVGTLEVISTRLREAHHVHDATVSNVRHPRRL